MKNETSSVYGTIYQIAIAVFIFVLVELYTIKESNDIIFFKDTSADFILSVVTSGIVFYVILELTKWAGCVPNVGVTSPIERCRL